MTGEQHRVVNAWAANTAAHFVNKVKGGWVVDFSAYEAVGPTNMGVFKTKRSATEAVDRTVCAMARRWREESQS